ncbi:dual specificity protein phosphatase 19-like [Tubulanus polymorphus]|uniref:dual specificity protein phosphatase 19-like n=1 Tax=Tubulanus polymorphus TaxID=672921 RepID=UPI003DA3F698
MSLLQDIECFNHSRLKSTETHVTFPSGLQTIEGKDSDGRPKVHVLSSTGSGFVRDLQPDLNSGTVLPGLILGSQDVALDYDELQKLKVTHILNVASSVDNAFPKKFTYKRIPILDLPNTNISEHFVDAIQFIDKARSKGGSVLVHCNAGVSRSATIVIAYLMKIERLSYDDAYDLARSARECIRPNDGFVQQLRTYERYLAVKIDR